MTIKKSHRLVAIDDLIIDSRVQRHEGVDMVRVNKIAADFQALALGSITVSLRSNGQMVVLDGAHRITAAKKVGYKHKVWADVLEGLDLETEGQVFLFLNNTRTPSAISKYLVRVVIGEREACEIDKILHAHGWEVRQASAPGVVAAVTAVERVYRNGGGVLPEGEHPELLDRVMELLTAAWEWDAHSVDSAMLLALAQLIGRFGPSIDTKKLVAEMQGTRPGVLVGKAKTLRDVQGGSVPAALAKILAGMHNKKRRTNLLPEWVWIR